MRNLSAAPLLALATSFLAATALSQTHSKILQKVKVPPKVVAPTAPVKPLPATIDFNMIDKGVVTASYFRMHHPEAFQQIAEQVKSGKISHGTLDTLISPTLQIGLFNTETTTPANLPKGTLRSKSRRSTPTPQTVTPIGKYHELAYANLKVNQVEFSPKEMKFSDSWDKQTVFARVHIISQTDGPVVAKLGPNSPFYIYSITAYNGMVLNARTRSGGQSSKRSIAASTTHAPWTLTTNAGQDVDVVLGFSPHFDLFKFVAGYYKDTLSVNGSYWNQNAPKQNPWSVDIPVSGRFNGVLIGTIFYADDRSGLAIEDPAYDPRVPQSVEFQVSVVNAGPDVTGTIVGDNLPPGITMQPVAVSCPTGQARHITLTIGVDRSGQYHLPLEVPITFGARFNHGNKSQAVEMQVTRYPGFHTWEWSGTAGSVDFNTTFTMYSTGDFGYNINGYNKNIVFGFDVQSRGDFGGHQIVNAALSVDSDSAFNYSYGFNVKDLQTNYLTYLKQNFHVRVSTH